MYPFRRKLTRSAINRRRNQCISKSDDRLFSVGFLNQDFAKIDMSNMVFHAYYSYEQEARVHQVKLAGRFNSNHLDSCVLHISIFQEPIGLYHAFIYLVCIWLLLLYNRSISLEFLAACFDFSPLLTTRGSLRDQV